MSDIVLVQPTYSEHKFSLDEVTPPMSLLCISSILHDKGYKVKIINQIIDPDWKSHLRNELDTNPICVGLTSVTGTQILYALQAARLVKEHSRVPVVWGGLHASMVPETTLSNPYVDYVVIGEAEETFTNLVYHLEDNRIPKENLHSVWRKENGAIIKTSSSPLPILGELPLIPFELDDAFHLRREPQITLITSRGCPHQCSFCFEAYSSHRKWRALDAQTIIDQIQLYHDKYANKSAGKLRVNFNTESNFFVDPKRVKELLKLLIKHDIPVSWDGISCRADYLKRIDDDTLSMLHELGCKRLLFGIESGSPKMLERMNKGITREDVFNSADKLIKHNITFHASFIFGLPHEDWTDRNLTMDLIDKLIHRYNDKLSFLLFHYVPYPGTEAYTESLKLGLDEPKTLEAWSKYEPRNLTNLPWYSEKDFIKADRISNVVILAGVYRQPGLAGFVQKIFRNWARIRFIKRWFRFFPEPAIYGFFNDGYHLITQGRLRQYHQYYKERLIYKIILKLKKL
ncbi:B12-binding domain-containing radical SAM protein [candidate division KSB1 bacterium]